MKNSSPCFPLRRSSLLVLSRERFNALPLTAGTTGFAKNAKGTLTLRSVFIKRDFKRDDGNMEDMMLNGLPHYIRNRTSDNFDFGLHASLPRPGAFVQNLIPGRSSCSMPEALLFR